MRRPKPDRGWFGGPEIGLDRGKMPQPTFGWRNIQVPPLTGNDRMTRPATRLFAAEETKRRFVLTRAWPARAVASPILVSRSPSCRRKGPSRSSGRGLLDRPAVPGRLSGSLVCPLGLSSLYSSHNPSRDAALRGQALAPMSGGSGPLTLERVSHAQQHAHRCVSPRRNEGGRPSR